MNPTVSHPAYPAAREAAVRIRSHFQRHISASAARKGGAVSEAPDAAPVEAMIEAAFWASLRREEGYIPRISLALVAPESVRWPLRFERQLPLATQALTRLAPAVERQGIHLGVWPTGGRYIVWGATRDLPAACLVIEVLAPGLLVVKHSRVKSEKFVNLAVLQGDEIKIIDEYSAHLPDCPELLTSLLGLDAQHASTESVSLLIRLAISMRDHGRGGLLLVVPADSETWRESIAQPVLYALAPPFAVLTDLINRATGVADRGEGALRSSVDAIAGLTAVDGATVITDRYEVLAFGAKIVRREGSPQVSNVIVTEPIEGAQAEVVDPGQLGGTRHLSAAQFVHDQRNVLVLAASQDGRFTVFAWSPCENMVHAHRIDSLLL